MKSQPHPVDRLLAGLRYGGAGRGHAVFLRKEDGLDAPWKLTTAGGLFQVSCEVEPADAQLVGIHFPGVFHHQAQVTQEALQSYFESLPMSRRIFAMDTSASTTQRTVSLFKDGKSLCTVMNEGPRPPGAELTVRNGQIVWDLYDPKELCQRWGDAFLERMESGDGIGRSYEAQHLAAIDCFKGVASQMTPIASEQTADQPMDAPRG